MRTTILVFFAFVFSNAVNAQKYVFYSSEIDKNTTLNVKGEFLGRINQEDVFYEKVDALNHKIKIIEFGYDSNAGAVGFKGMSVYHIDETLLSVTGLKPIVKKDASGKNYYVVNLKPINKNKPLKSKNFIKSKGIMADAFASEYDINAPFPTKEKAEAFIADLKTLFK